MARGNVLFITLDQLRADVVRGALASHVPLPNFERLAVGGRVFTNHFTVTVPCGPARASLLTGLYAMNHRAVRNGAPLARHHATIATEARKAGYEPLLFGYTDQAADPTGMDPEDPDLSGYEGVAPGFRELVEMRLEEGLEWPAYLVSQGYRLEFEDGAPLPSHYRPVASSGNLPAINDPAPFKAEHSDTAYLTDRTLSALALRTRKPWFAHLTYIRPHPPLIAPEPWNRLIDPATLPPARENRPEHRFLDAWFSEKADPTLFWGFDGDTKALKPEEVATARAVYLGLVAEVDHHIGRVLDWLEESGQDANTLVVLTSDHGEMLGDKQMWGKQSVFDPAFRVPLIIRDPTRSDGGREIGALTESVDIAPTILDWIGLAPPPAMDGKSLLGLMDDDEQPWRDGVFMEADFAHPLKPTRFQRHLGLDTNQCNATIYREAGWKLVEFGGGIPPMLFDLAGDPHETRNLAAEPAMAGEVSRLRGRMLARMMERRDRRLTHYAFGN